MLSDSNGRILLVEDDELTREAFELYFSQHGWQLDSFADGNQGLKAAIDNDYDLVITDLQMPEISGIELLKKISQAKPNQTVMAISGGGTFEDVVALLRGGAVDFVRKPVNLPQLQQTITKLVSCAKEEEFENTIYNHIQYEETQHSFSSLEIATKRVSLPIINRLLHSKIIDKQMSLRLKLAFQEALVNSLEHGNLELNSNWKDEFDQEGNDHFSHMKKERLNDTKYAQRKILLTSIYQQDKLIVKIKNEGPGFTPPCLNIEKDSLNEISTRGYGRGLTILLGMLDQISYSQDGTELTLIKKLK